MDRINDLQLFLQRSKDRCFYKDTITFCSYAGVKTKNIKTSIEVSQNDLQFLIEFLEAFKGKKDA